MPTSYDPKKAEAYNKLIQSGMSEDAAFSQSGITDAAAGNYALGSNGQLGAAIAGSGKVAGVDYDNITAADAAASNRFTQGLQSSSNFEQVDYAEKASAPPGNVTPSSSTTTNNSGFALSLPGGTVLFKDQAELDDYSADPQSYAKSFVGNGYILDKIPTPPVTQESVFDPRQDVGENVFDPGATFNGPATEESVFDPRQDVGENVFDPGTTYNGPTTEESVFDPRQDVGENVFDPDSAVPRSELADAAVGVNDPYYGLSPAQLKALGGADPTDPYIRARLGIPQLSGSTLNPGGFAAFKPTGVPLIDGAISAISSFASSLSSFFGPPTKPTVTQQGTTTGAQAAVGTPVNLANAQTARDQPVNPASDPSQFPAYDDDGNLKDGFAVNNETGETYFQGYPGNVNNASESVFDPRQDVGENVFDPGQTYNGPATEESVFDPRQDPAESVFDPDSAVPRSELADAAVGVNDPYYGLSPAQLEALGGADPTDPYIRARLGIPQLQDSPLAATPGFGTIKTGVPIIDNVLGALGNLFSPPTKPAVTDQGTTTGQPVIAPDTAAVAADAAAIQTQNTNLTDDEKTNLENISGAQVEIDRAQENIQANNRSILANEEAQASAQEQQRQAQAIIDQNNAELADENLPDDRRAELEANNAAQQASIAENAAIIDETQTNIDSATTNTEQQQQSIQTNQEVVVENAAAFSANGNTLDAAVAVEDDPELAAAQANVDAELVDNPDVVVPDDVIAEVDLELAAAEAAVAAPLEATSDVVIPEDVNPDADAELQEPPGTEGEITDLAEPVDPESDPELLAGEEDEPLTELAEPPDPDADPELLAGPEEEEPYTELAEPPTDEPEQLGDPDLQDGEITDLAEPVDPDADPELVQLGDPALREEEETGPEQLSGPTDVNPNADPGVPGGLSDEEQQARQNPGGLSDEELLERQAAAERSAAKANTINQATLQSRYKQPGNTDWRVRLSLAKSSDYLYNSADVGILRPLAASNGVIFPYMPQISTAYRANYEHYDLVHSNFRGVYYKSSRVDDIQIRGTFTAQDTTEAAYLLATIHFFRSVTKMFYGKDPQRGTPPPLVYLSGLGDYQFSKHPCLVSQFSYTLPNDVDYIRATNVNDYGGNLSSRRAPVQASPGGINFAGARRLANTITASGPLTKGATPQTPESNSVTGRVNNTGDFSTYVPTMMEIDITLVPVQTRSQVSKQFSLKDFANGNLLKGGFW